jgi:nucleoside-diphosphate kinase
VKFDPEMHSLVIFKPDSIRNRQLGIGGMFSTFAAISLHPVRGVLKVMTQTDIENHYAAHVEKPFFPALAEFMKSGPSMIVLMMGSWSNARKMAEDIRAAYKCVNPANMVHASDSPEAVLTETKLWFPEEANPW